MAQFHSNELTIIEAMEKICQECKTLWLAVDLAKEYIHAHGSDGAKEKIQALQVQEEAFARVFSIVSNPNAPRRHTLLKNRETVFCFGLDMLYTYKALLAAELSANYWQNYSQERLQRAKEKFSDIPSVVERYQALLASGDALAAELQKNIDIYQQQGFTPEN